MKTFTVITYENGKRIQEQVPVSKEMQKTFNEIAEFNKKHPNFWCSCEARDRDGKEIIHHRGHSVDVQCGNCSGWLQIG